MAFSFGSDNDFGANQTSLSASPNDTDEIAVIYNDGGNSSYLTGRIINYNTGAGTADTISTTRAGAIAPVDTDKHVVVFTDSADGNKLKASILTPSGFSSTLTLDTNSCSDPTVAALTTSLAVAAYRRGSDLYAIDFTVSGSAPTSAGTAVDSGANYTPFAFVALDSTRALISYSNAISNNFLNTIDASSGISWGTSANLAVTGFDRTKRNGLTKIDTDKSVIELGDGDIVVVNTSGASAPTFGTEYASGFTGGSAGLYAIDTDTILIAGTESGASKLESLDIDGSDNITSNSDQAQFDGDGVNDVAAPVSTDKAAGELIIFWRSDADSYAHWITASGAPTPPVGGMTYALTHSANAIPGAILV